MIIVSDWLMLLWVNLAVIIFCGVLLALMARAEHRAQVARQAAIDRRRDLATAAWRARAAAATEEIRRGLAHLN